MILGSNGYALSMGNYVLADTSLPPVQYTLNIGGDSSYTVQATARYNGVDTYPTGVWTAARTLPVYAGSTVTAKLSNKSAYYRYNLSVSGLSATASSRDSAYTYITGVMTGDGYVATASLTQNKFTATATELSVYTQYYNTRSACHGGFIFRKSATTYPGFISEEESWENVRYTTKWSPSTFATGSIKTTTFSSPIISGYVRSTATMPYRQSTTGVTSYMSYWTNFESGAGQTLSTFECRGGNSNVRTATLTPTSNVTPTSTPFMWWELYPRGAGYASWEIADFQISAILTGIAY